MIKNNILLVIIILIALLINIPVYAFQFNIKGSDKVQLGIYDEQNRYSGYVVNNPDEGIVNSSYFKGGSSAEGDVSDPNVTINNYIHGSSPDGFGGKYKLVIYGQQLSNYQLDGWMMERKVNMGYFTLIGIIDIGQIKYYEINYTPMQNPVINRIATSNDLIADITTAQKLNLIGNAKFVSELVKDINEIEKERLKVDPSHGSGDDGLTPAQKAKKEYSELLKEITEKYNKPESDEFLKQEAYTVLKEDMEYIIGHM